MASVSILTRTYYLVVLHLAIASIQTMAAAEGKPSIRCFSGVFTEGSRALVTCLFHENVNATKHGFNIKHYAPGAEGMGNYILLCNWHSDEVECKTEAGYRLSGHSIISDQLTVEVETATKDAEGMYACQVVPDDSAEIHTCWLSVVGPPINMLCSTTGSDCAEHDTQTDTQTCDGVTAWAVIMTLLFLLLAAAVAVVFFLYYRRKTQTKGGNFTLLDVLPCFARANRSSLPSTTEEQTRDVEQGECTALMTTAEDETRVNANQTGDTQERNTVSEVSNVRPTTTADVAATVTAARSSTANRASTATSVHRASTATTAVHAATGSTSTAAQTSVKVKSQQTQAGPVAKLDINTQTQKQVMVVEWWTSEDIRQWLMEVSVEIAYQPLLAKDMTGTKLLQLNHEKELKKLGIADSDARKLKEKINLLKQFNKALHEEEDDKQTKEMPSDSRRESTL